MSTTIQDYLAQLRTYQLDKYGDQAPGLYIALAVVDPLPGETPRDAAEAAGCTAELALPTG